MPSDSTLPTIYAHADAIEARLDRLPLHGSPRYTNLLIAAENHLANAVSALDAAILEAQKGDK